MRPPGQLLVVVAILIMALLMLMALVVDGGRLFVEQSRMSRAAQAGADAGMVWVADQMVTLAIPRQTEAANQPACDPDAGFGTPSAVCTATPLPQRVAAWLNDEDLSTLAAPPARATAQSLARDYVARNGFPPWQPYVLALEVDYPASGRADFPLGIRVRLERRTEVLLAGLLDRAFVDLAVEALSEVSLR